MSIIEFPIREAAQRTATRPIGTSAEIIPFPAPPVGLTRSDIATLFRIVGESSTAWLLETERDGKGAVWAIVTPRDPSLHDYRAFLVCRQNHKLILIDARLTARWEALGVFGRADALAEALAKMIGAKSLPRPRVSR